MYETKIRECNALCMRHLEFRKNKFQRHNQETNVWDNSKGVGEESKAMYMRHIGRTTKRIRKRASGCMYETFRVDNTKGFGKEC